MQNRNTLPASYFQHVPKTSRADDNSLCPGQSNHGICLNITPRALEEIHGHFQPSQGAQCQDLDEWVLQPEHPSLPGRERVNADSSTHDQVPDSAGLSGLHVPGDVGKLGVY